MRDLIDLAEGVNPSVLYHFTDSAGLERILSEDRLASGAKAHTVNGKETYGISVTRDRYLDLQNTYAVAGKKCWRIGLDQAELARRYRITPVRDDYLQDKPRGERGERDARIGFFSLGYKERFSHDEMEEFIVCDEIENISDYIVSLAVEDRWVDIDMTPHDAWLSDDGEVDHEDQDVFLSVIHHLDPEVYDRMRAARGHQPKMLHCPDVPFTFLVRDPYSENPVLPLLRRYTDRKKAS